MTELNKNIKGKKNFGKIILFFEMVIYLQFFLFTIALSLGIPYFVIVFSNKFFSPLSFFYSSIFLIMYFTLIFGILIFIIYDNKENLSKFSIKKKVFSLLERKKEILEDNILLTVKYIVMIGVFTFVNINIIFFLFYVPTYLM